MSIFWCIMFVFLRNKPSDAGFRNFDTGEATLSDDGERLPVGTAIKRIFQHPVLRWVCLIEFCSGFLRNGIMHWYTFFGKEVGFYSDFFITRNWGLSLLLCGLIGANATGWISDKLFNSRRGPMCSICYGLMTLGCVLLVFSLSGILPTGGGTWSGLWPPALAALCISMGVIAVHGILSGTATADFGGTKNTGIVVGIVDGIVYLGTGLQSIIIGQLVPQGVAASQANAWLAWPLVLLPFALLGFFFSIKIWHALPKPRAQPEPSQDAPHPSAAAEPAQAQL